MEKVIELSSNKIQFSWNFIDVTCHILINFCAYFFFLTLLGAINYANFIFISLICGIAQALIKLGQNDYIIVTKNISDDDLSGIFTFNILIGVSSFITLITIFFVIFYTSEKNLTFFISAIIMSLGVLLTGLSNSFLTVLQKNQEFKKLFIINLSSSIFGIFTVYIFSNFIDPIFYPFIMALGTALSLFVILISLKIFQPKVSIKKMKHTYQSAKMFVIPLAKNRPIITASKNIDSFLVLYLGGDLLLVTYTTFKKVLIFPLTTLYGILDRWLYPLLAKLDGNEKVKSEYLKYSKHILVVSTLAIIPACVLLIFVQAPMVNYFANIGITNINVLLIAFGFIFTWPFFTMPVLINPYAKVSRLTHLLPRFSIFTSLSIMLFIFTANVFFGENWITFGYALAFLTMNIYVILNFKF
ncbi:oligosaccharide flippase family protein [Gammaproteobacteria bacterium]|nr:oligosaccharide flippase family protein [Gammaproteobacteria bacterium]